MKKIKGFTLVELMVVIVIIGILAALAIPRFLGATNKTKASEFKPVLKQIYTLQMAYKQEKDSYANNLNDIAFEQPAANSRFSYSAPATAPATSNSAATAIGEAQLKTTGSIKDVTNTDIAGGSKACVDGEGIQYAISALATLANVTPGTCF